MSAAYLDSFKLEVFLNGAWVNLAGDVYDNPGIVVQQGIAGGQDTDLVARPGTLTCELYNATGKYTPGGAGALAGWQLDIKIRLVVVYDSQESIQFVGWLREIRPVIQSGEQQRVKITAYDWLEQALRAPIIAPQIQDNWTAGQAAQAVINLCPITPEAVNLHSGSTFLTVFDSVTGNTTAYGELVKIAQSEFGHLYCLKDGTLVLESGDLRNGSVEPKKILVLKSEESSVLLTNGDLLLLQDGSQLLQNTYWYEILTNNYEKLDVEFGAYYANFGKVIAYPRRVDQTPVILAKTNEPVLVNAGQSVTIKLPYVDPLGISRQVTALTNQMITPSPGQTIDPTLMALVSFNLDVNDATGKQTWTSGESPAPIFGDIYSDGYGIVRVSSAPPIGGGYLVCGGYSNYRITTPASSNFNFGNQPFTIGWWEARININQTVGSIASDNIASTPGWLLNVLNPATRDMLIYISSNGTTWNIANGRSFGKIAASRWRYYELCRDVDGWFYAFADGKLTDKWYSSLPVMNSQNLVSIGQTQNNQWAFTAIADFFVHKNRCLHVNDFEPPKIPKNIYLDEDYWGNTAQNRSGTEITNQIAITPIYGPRDVTVTIQNSSAQNGYVYFQQRGHGIYFDAPIEGIVQDTALIATDGYQELTINQKYQHALNFGLEKMTNIINARKTKRADLKEMRFLANVSKSAMLQALYLDIGDLLQVQYTNVIDGYYYIQSRRLELQDRKLRVTWTFKQDFTHA